MSIEQLRDWIAACERLELWVNPAKPRRSWKQAGEKTAAELERRAGTAGS